MAGVLGTANHLWLDVVGGTVAAGAGFVVAVMGRTALTWRESRWAAQPRSGIVDVFSDPSLRRPARTLDDAHLGRRHRRRASADWPRPCACRAPGFDVVVLEQRDAPGGRASQLRTDGYTWDTGPSLITMPWVLEEAFAAGGLDLHSEVTLRRLDPLYRIRWASDDRHFDFYADAERLREQVARFSARDAANVDGFLAALRPIYEEGILGAGRRAFGDLRSFAPLLPRMARLGAVVPLHRFVARCFRHPRVREAFSFHSLFIGGDPFRVPAIYGALAYLQVLDGGWYCDGGVYSLVQAMARPLDVRCATRAVAIERSRDGVSGVKLADGRGSPPTSSISNADVLRTHELLGVRRSWRRLRPHDVVLPALPRAGPASSRRCCTTRCWSGADTARSSATSRADGSCPRSFSTYVHAPARTEPGMAPEGGDSLAVLLPVPNLRADVDWGREADTLRDTLVADLETRFGLDGAGGIGGRRAPDGAAGLRPRVRRGGRQRVRGRTDPASVARTSVRTTASGVPASTTSARARIPGRGSPASCSARR